MQLLTGTISYLIKKEEKKCYTQVLCYFLVTTFWSLFLMHNTLQCITSDDDTNHTHTPITGDLHPSQVTSQWLISVTSDLHVSQVSKIMTTAHLSAADVNTELVSMKSFRLCNLSRIGISWSAVNVFVNYDQHKPTHTPHVITSYHTHAPYHHILSYTHPTSSHLVSTTT